MTAASRPHPQRSAPRWRAEIAHRPSAVRAGSRGRGPVLWWVLGALAVAGAILAMAVVNKPGQAAAQSSVSRTAPGFTLQSTGGGAVNLSSYRGRPVVLYFSEGVGCDACFYQMAEFEKHSADLSAAGVTLVPIVMNPAEQVRQEMTRFNLRTPFLIDADGAVSGQYGVLGKGMHQGLPGHGFVLIDGSGTERWYGEYPSMYLSTADLLAQVKTHLAG